MQHLYLKHRLNRSILFSANPIEIIPNMAYRYVFEEITKIPSPIYYKYTAKMEVNIKVNICRNTLATIPLLLSI